MEDMAQRSCNYITHQAPKTFSIILTGPLGYRNRLASLDRTDEWTDGTEGDVQFLAGTFSIA
jgi:hypothetical protein